jgi:hypothetical protein
VSTTPGAKFHRRPPAGTLSLISSHHRTLCLLGVTALGGFGLLAPAAAPAEATPPSGHHARAGRPRPCPLAIEVTPTRVTAGDSATVSGSLTCPSAGEAGEQTIAIYQHMAGTPGFSAVGSATPEADGAFHFNSEPLQANSVFYARAQDSESGEAVPSVTGAEGSLGARSRPMPVKVSPLVTLTDSQASTQPSIVAGHEAARASNTVTFTGTVVPDEVGATVVLQREGVNIEENWQRIAVGEVGAEGTYSITHTFGIPGSANVRVVVHPHGLLPGVSDALSLQLMRRQNPQLTIQGSAQPLTAGQAFTLSGIAAGAGQEPLTLLAKTGASGLAPLATTTSEGDGSYAFAPQTPTADTWYEVTAAHVHSSTLFEGVRPQLSATVSSPSAEDGGSVTFTGTVDPTAAEQTVELQRENADGLGFHVLEVGTVTPGGSFSIEHVVAGAGTQAFRIVVPARAGLQATASGPLAVQVTRSPGASLEPEAPGPPLEEG